MSVISNPPFPSYFDTDGTPLENGYLYFGVSGQNPETNPIVVYWDAAYTQPAVQPIRTSGGFAWRNGSPANIYVSTDFSMTVRDKNKRVVYSKLVSDAQTGGSVNLQFTRQSITATASQTVFSLSSAYTPGNNSLAVYRNGVLLTLSTDYTETSSTVVTLTSVLIGPVERDSCDGITSSGVNNYNKYNLDHILAQWEALPNFVGDANILPLVDVSGSMTSPAGGWQSKSTVSCLDVSVSLGLYLADKNKGKFKDTFLTFSDHPELLHLKGNILDKINQMVKSSWKMNTNLHAAIKKILDVAIEGNVPQEEMPKILLILSDMQFDQCAQFDDSAMEMIARKYQDAGYEIPKVVFWNFNAAYGNTPVAFDKSGTALVSGFSPAVVKPLLAGDLETFTPESVMLKTIMDDRYKVL